MSLSLLAEWVNKAEADYQSAVALHRRRKAPLPDIVCYLCQQCVEKYLKAYLIAQGSMPPRIHDLEELLNLCALYDATSSHGCHWCKSSILTPCSVATLA